MHLKLTLFLTLGLWFGGYGQLQPPLAPAVDRQPLEFSPEQQLSNYVQIPSVSGQEEAAGLYFQTRCRQAGLQIQSFGTENGNFNFAASLYPLSSGKPNIVFLNHIDVVPAEEEQEWRYPPFSGKIAEGQVWGRGAFDNKGVAIMQLHAIQQYVALAQNNDLPYNVSLLALSCEETQCEGGAQYVVEHFLGTLNPCIIIGEGPPSLEGVISTDPDKVVFGIATGHKRAYWLKLQLDIPTAGHGSVTPLEYANKNIVEALDRLLSRKQQAVYTEENLNILRELGALEGGVLGFVLKKPRLFKPLIIAQLRKQPEVFALFSNTITLTNMANSTSAHNAIPESVSCLLDCRLLPETDEAAFLEEVIKRLNNDDIQVEVVLANPSTKCSPASHPMYSLLETSIQDYFGQDIAIVPLLLPNINDSGWFRAKGIPAFDFIPAKIPRTHLECIHSYDERISIDALYQGIQVYSDFLSKLLIGVAEYTEKR
jgi:acetylornithine deacetylase/succinyl-diaminopimelate desuccinylase-like protein